MTEGHITEPVGGSNIPDLLTVHELASILKLSHRSIWRLVRSSQLPAPIHLGSSTRWRAADIAAWLKRGGTAAAEGDSAAGEPAEPQV
jgi:excisionase family DNA binding protein